MYSDRWSPGLRQGDIVGPLLFPTLGTQFSVVSTTRSLSDAGISGFQFVQVPVDSRLVAIASHDCEFNTGKRNKLLVARLEDLPGNLDQDARAALRASNDIHARADAGETVAGVNSFVFAPLAGTFDDEQIAVFTTISPLPMKMHDDLVALKRAELVQPERVCFREKLAWFFGRDADDIEEVAKVDAPATKIS